MAYTYTCPHCGKRHSAQSLLFDLAKLLPDEEEWKVLKLRLTPGELAALAQKGEWKPSLSDLMGMIANKNNLNDRVITTLTIEQIDEFLAAVDASNGEDDDDPISLFELAAPMDETPDALEEYDMPHAIHALCDKVVSCVSNQQVERMVADDLRMIQALFAHSDPTCAFRLLKKSDASGGQVITGVILETPWGKRLMDTRVCPTCGKAVPEVACTIPQHLVTFIGGPATGKTSTLVALAHYAKNRSSYLVDDPIWGDTPTIHGVRMMTLLDVSDDLERDMRNFEVGIVPYRTEARRPSNHAVQLQVTDCDGHHALLTLMDLPGEMYLAGRLDAEKILNDFPAVLSSDVLVHCISDETMESSQYVTAAVNCTASLLQLKSQFTAGTCPVLTLYTKSDSDDARRENDQLNKYRQVLKQFDIPGYRAGMSCRCFGYPAPTENEMEWHGAAPVSPKPRNIHLVLQWLLAVTGCIDAESVNPITGERRTGRVSRPQDRSQNPISQEEAIARCTLFENPGQHDKAFLEVTTSFQRMMLKLRMSRQPNDA